MSRNVRVCVFSLSFVFCHLSSKREYRERKHDLVACTQPSNRLHADRKVPSRSKASQTHILTAESVCFEFLLSALRSLWRSTRRWWVLVLLSSYSGDKIQKNTITFRVLLRIQCIRFGLWDKTRTSSLFIHFSKNHLFSLSIFGCISTIRSP